jgi:hypothetical protein
VNHIGRILTVSRMRYALGMCPFLISEHHRPQATLAWMLACIGEDICRPFCARPQELSNGVRALIHLGSAPMNGPTRPQETPLRRSGRGGGRALDSPDAPGPGSCSNPLSELVVSGEVQAKRSCSKRACAIGSGAAASLALQAQRAENLR